MCKFEHLFVQFKFSEYGHKQASKQDIHTHVRNAVTLVWGLLRLVPTRPNEMVSVLAFWSHDHEKLEKNMETRLSWS